MYICQQTNKHLSVIACFFSEGSKINFGQISAVAGNSMMKNNTKSALQHPIFYHYTVSNCSEGQKHTLPQPEGKLPWFTSSQHTE